MQYRHAPRPARPFPVASAFAALALSSVALLACNGQIATPAQNDDRPPPPASSDAGSNGQTAFPSSNDRRDAGASGAGGATGARDGGALSTGAGGAPAGTGGAPAGAGPGPAGTGGARAGTGGAQAGTGGPRAGTGGAPAGTGGATAVVPPDAGAPPARAGIQYVFVIAMENEPAAAIYGSASAPYINGQLLPRYARATAFADPLPDGIPSEPHYIWMEAGTNKFSDVTFTGDGDPSASNSTASTAHLSTQMDHATPPVTWLSYQEGLNSSTGACPVRSSGFYAGKHDPFIFFRDVAGSPPSASNAACAAHHRPYTALAQDLKAKTVARYNFISPDICHDMHGDSSCPGSDDIRTGDDWLRAELPALLDFVNANDGVIFLVWDEPEGGSSLVPFVAMGPRVKTGYASSVAFDHGSLLKTVEEIFGLPILPTVAATNDLADLFVGGTLR